MRVWLPVLLSLLISDADAHEEIAIQNAKADIQRIFAKDFKDKQDIKELVIMHSQKNDEIYNAKVACGNLALLSFDDSFVFLNAADKRITASIIAHELAHCSLGHKGPKLAHAGSKGLIAMELAADKLGLKYFVAAGYKAQDFKLQFDCTDTEMNKDNPTHPDHKTRCEAIDKAIKEGDL